MRKKILAAVLAAATALSLAAPAFDEEAKETNVVYLGVEGYGTLTREDMDAFVHRFFVNGAEKTYKVSAENNYAVQNVLAEGYVFDITVED